MHDYYLSEIIRLIALKTRTKDLIEKATNVDPSVVTALSAEIEFIKKSINLSQPAVGRTNFDVFEVQNGSMVESKLTDRLNASSFAHLVLGLNASTFIDDDQQSMKAVEQPLPSAVELSKDKVASNEQSLEDPLNELAVNMFNKLKIKKNYAVESVKKTLHSPAHLRQIFELSNEVDRTFEKAVSALTHTPDKKLLSAWILKYCPQLDKMELETNIDVLYEVIFEKTGLFQQFVKGMARDFWVTWMPKVQSEVAQIRSKVKGISSINALMACLEDHFKMAGSTDPHAMRHPLYFIKRKLQLKNDSKLNLTVYLESLEFELLLEHSLIKGLPREKAVNQEIERLRTVHFDRLFLVNNPVGNVSLHPSFYFTEDKVACDCAVYFVQKIYSSEKIRSVLLDLASQKFDYLQTLTESQLQEHAPKFWYQELANKTAKQLISVDEHLQKFNDSQKKLRTSLNLTASINSSPTDTNDNTEKEQDNSRNISNQMQKSFSSSFAVIKNRFSSVFERTVSGSCISFFPLELLNAKNEKSYVCLVAISGRPNTLEQQKGQAELNELMTKFIKMLPPLQIEKKSYTFHYCLDAPKTLDWILDQINKSLTPLMVPLSSSFQQGILPSEPGKACSEKKILAELVRLSRCEEVIGIKILGSSNMMMPTSEQFKTDSLIKSQKEYQLFQNRDYCLLNLEPFLHNLLAASIEFFSSCRKKWKENTLAVGQEKTIVFDLTSQLANCVHKLEKFLSMIDLETVPQAQVKQLNERQLAFVNMINKIKEKLAPLSKRSESNEKGVLEEGISKAITILELHQTHMLTGMKKASAAKERKRESNVFLQIENVGVIQTDFIACCPICVVNKKPALTLICRSFQNFQRREKEGSLNQKIEQTSIDRENEKKKPALDSQYN